MSLTVEVTLVIGAKLVVTEKSTYSYVFFIAITTPTPELKQNIALGDSCSMISLLCTNPISLLAELPPLEAAAPCHA
jgi:hypothetical protein